MAETERVRSRGKKRDRLETRLIQPPSSAPRGFASLAPAIERGSTVLFDKLADAHGDWDSAHYVYGLFGTPTVRELGIRIADLEGARHSFIVPSGLAAISLTDLAFCPAGSHLLVPENVYGPHRLLGQTLLRDLDIEMEEYPPLIGGSITDLVRPQTRLVWLESPGSITMEVQDVPAMTAALRDRGVTVALDNTYSAGLLFDAFTAGVDISVQALTKYVGGHGDLLLGSISVGSEKAYRTVGGTLRAAGMGVSPEDSALALRGLQTLAVRLEALERSTLEVARWLAARPEVETMLHPAFEDCPGHQVWKRDFTGSASIFSVILEPGWTAERLERFVDSLRLFRIGYSWGGTTSLVMAYPDLPLAERLVRLNIGLEAPQDLIADLEQALASA